MERNTRLALGAGVSRFRVGGAIVFLPLRGPVAVSSCGRELSSWLGVEKMHTAAGWLPLASPRSNRLVRNTIKSELGVGSPRIAPPPGTLRKPPGALRRSGSLPGPSWGHSGSLQGPPPLPEPPGTFREPSALNHGACSTYRPKPVHLCGCAFLAQTIWTQLLARCHPSGGAFLAQTICFHTFFIMPQAAN